MISERKELFISEHRQHVLDSGDDLLIVEGDGGLIVVEEDLVAEFKFREEGDLIRFEFGLLRHGQAHDLPKLLFVGLDGFGEGDEAGLRMPSNGFEQEAWAQEADHCARHRSSVFSGSNARKLESLILR